MNFSIIQWKWGRFYFPSLSYRLDILITGYEEFVEIKKSFDWIIQDKIPETDGK